MDEKYKQHITDPEILALLESMKDWSERVERKKREYHERKAFVRKVFGKAVEQALGIKPKED